jgi:hypothetical protein
VEHHDSTIGVSDRLYIHSKSEPLKELTRHANGIGTRGTPNHTTGCFILYAQEQVPATLIRQRNAVFAKFAPIDLGLRFLEFQPLMFRGRLSPKIDLVHRNRHLRNLRISPSV